MPHFHALGTRFRVSADRYGAGRQSDARLGLEANAAPARAGGLCVPVPVPVPRPLAPYGRLLNLPDCFRVRAPTPARRAGAAAHVATGPAARARMGSRTPASCVTCSFLASPRAPNFLSSSGIGKISYQLL